MTVCPACGKRLSRSEEEQRDHDAAMSMHAGVDVFPLPPTFGPNRCCSEQCARVVAWLVEEDPEGARRLGLAIDAPAQGRPRPGRGRAGLA